MWITLFQEDLRETTYGDPLIDRRKIGFPQGNPGSAGRKVCRPQGLPTARSPHGGLTASYTDCKVPAPAGPRIRTGERSRKVRRNGAPTHGRYFPRFKCLRGRPSNAAATGTFMPGWRAFHKNTQVADARGHCRCSFRCTQGPAVDVPLVR